MSYTLLDLVGSLRLDDCKIQNTPDILFLCGGPTAEDGPYLSARDFFNRYLETKPNLARRVRLAEEINAWYHKDKAFADLLELENHLAHVAGVTILFVESAGSIAELGAFAASEDLRPKTLAILNEFHGIEDSFIADGPVRRLEFGNKNHVHFYNWDPADLNSKGTLRALREVAKEVTSFLEDRDAARPKQTEFKRQNIGHNLLLVAELVRISGVASRSDVAACLSEIGCDSSASTLNRHLSILESVGIISKRRRHVETFYVPSFTHPFLRYAYTKEAPLREAARIQHAIRQSLDSRRKFVLADALRKASAHA